MRKARTILFCLLGFCIFPLSAELKFFAGLEGDFAFPAFYEGEKLYGFGGGGNLEGGVYLGDLSLGLTARIAHSNDEGELVKKMTDFTIGPQVGYSFGRDMIYFFPEWLCVRPNLSLLLDVYNSDGFRSNTKKGAGKEENTQGCAFAFETGLCVDFPNLLSYNQFEFVPTIGYYETFCVEEKAMIFSGRISFGMRVLFTPSFD